VHTTSVSSLTLIVLVVIRAMLAVQNSLRIHFINKGRWRPVY